MTRRAAVATPRSVRDDRLAQGAAAIYSPSEAARLLPRLDREAAVAWLRRHGLIHHIEGREVVIWGDVLDCIRAGNAPGAARVVPGRFTFMEAD